jgi:hypothetical protein
MENAPVISFVSRYFLPGDEAKHNDYYEKWFFDAYVPFLAENVGLRGAERYRIIHDNPDYPRYMQLWYFNNLKEYQAFEKSDELMAILSAMDANFPGTDFRWWVQYRVVKSWQSGRLGQFPEPTDGAIIHLETSQEPVNDEKYNTELIKTGEARRVDLCHLVKTNPKYPTFLAIFRFPTIALFEDWRQKRKQAALTPEAAAAPGAGPSWNIQYQLTRSWQR